jgi:hypothetical protein
MAWAFAALGIVLIGIMLTAIVRFVRRILLIAAWADDDQEDFDNWTSSSGI